MQKNLGVDVDGVITNIQDFIFEFGAKYAYDGDFDLANLNKDSYDSAVTFNWCRETDNNFWQQMLEKYSREERPRQLVSEVLYKIKEADWKIHIITARKSIKEEDIKERKIEKILENWLEEHDIPYDVLVFTGNSKVDALKEHQIDIMIEDSPSNIEELRKICPIIVFDAMYNKECNGEDLVRVNSWYEILHYLEKVFEKQQED